MFGNDKKPAELRLDAWSAVQFLRELADEMEEERATLTSIEVFHWQSRAERSLNVKWKVDDKGRATR